MPFEGIQRGIENLGEGIARGMNSATAEKSRLFWEQVSEGRRKSEADAAVDREKAIHVRNREEQLADAEKVQKRAIRNTLFSHAVGQVDTAIEHAQQLGTDYLTDPNSTLNELYDLKRKLIADPEADPSVMQFPESYVSGVVKENNARRKAAADTQAAINAERVARAEKESGGNDLYGILPDANGVHSVVSEKDIKRRSNTIRSMIATSKLAHTGATTGTWVPTVRDKALLAQLKTLQNASLNATDRGTAEADAKVATAEAVPRIRAFRAGQKNLNDALSRNFPNLRAPVTSATNATTLPPDIPAGSIRLPVVTDGNVPVYRTPDGRLVVSDFSAREN